MTDRSVEATGREGKVAPNLLDAAAAALAVFDVWQSDGTRYAEASDLRAAIAAHRQQADDNALLLRAICKGCGVDIVDPEVAGCGVGILIGSENAVIDTTLDPTGCPVLTDELRDALRAAMGGGE